MEEDPDNGKKSSHSAHAMEWMNKRKKLAYVTSHQPQYFIFNEGVRIHNIQSVVGQRAHK